MVIFSFWRRLIRGILRFFGESAWSADFSQMVKKLAGFLQNVSFFRENVLCRGGIRKFPTFWAQFLAFSVAFCCFLHFRSKIARII